MRIGYTDPCHHWGTVVLQVMTVAKSLCKDSITICATIHSPTAAAFKLFDKLIILVRGHMVYFGDAGRALHLLACEPALVVCLQPHWHCVTLCGVQWLIMFLNVVLGMQTDIICRPQLLRHFRVRVHNSLVM